MSSSWFQVFNGFDFSFRWGDTENTNKMCLSVKLLESSLIK